MFDMVLNTSMYEISTPPIKKKNDLFTLKEMCVKVQKTWIAQRISTNFSIWVSNDNKLWQTVCIWRL